MILSSLQGAAIALHQVAATRAPMRAQAPETASPGPPTDAAGAFHSAGAGVPESPRSPGSVTAPAATPAPAVTVVVTMTIDADGRVDMHL